MDFSQYAGQDSPFATMPEDTLAFVVIAVRDTKVSPEKGTRYYDCELTIIGDTHPYVGRKVFYNLMDPTYDGNSPGAKQMGQIAITRVLEVNGAGPNNVAGYSIPDMTWIHGKVGAVRLSFVSADANKGYKEKNEVKEWLTPNPTSKSGHKGYPELLAGKFLPANAPAPAAAPPPAQGTMFQTAQAAPAATAPAQAPAAGFPTQPAQAQTPAPAAGPTWANGAPAVAQPPAASPSSPAAPQPSAWLAQAQQS
jgi:hypothetical protein